MTEINFAYRSYFILPRVYLVESGKGFAPLLLGIYDLEYGIRTPSYAPGKFIDDRGETEYPDDQYREKQAMHLAFKHKPLGNYPILKNMGNGHFHEKYIVSINDISPNDVYRSDSDGNIIIWGNLKQDPPYSKTLWNGRQVTLVEIEPYLTPEELDQLARDSEYLSKVIMDNKQAMEQVYKHRNENRLLTTRVAAGLSTIALLQGKINSLLDNYELTMEEVIALRLENGSKLNKGIKLAEGKYGINAPWDKVAEEDMTKTIASIRQEIRKIGALADADGIMNDNIKAVLFQQTLSTLGLDYVRKAIGAATTDGLTSIPVKPSPTQELLEYTKQHDSAQITDAELQLRIQDMLKKMEGEQQSTPNSATVRQEPQTQMVDKYGRSLAPLQVTR